MTEPVLTDGYDGNSETREAYITRMEAEGHKVIKPAANELLIDIDSDDQHEQFLYGLQVLERNGIKPVKIDERPSRSGLPCRHITVTLGFDVEPWQRIAWQGALGSDPVRELVSAIRLRCGDVHPTLFVESA